MNSKLGPQYINSINYYQQQPFKINKYKLDILIKQHKKYSREYTKDINLNNVFENALNFLELNIDLITSTYKLNKKQIYLEYKKYINETTKFYNTIILANIFKDSNIYFTTFLDFRGRVYTNGYLLSI